MPHAGTAPDGADHIAVVALRVGRALEMLGGNAFRRDHTGRTKLDGKER